MKKLLLSSCIFLLAGCAKEYSYSRTPEPPTLNKPPVALAGPDQIITFPLDSVKLDGSLSYDPDGTIQQYSWTQLSAISTLVFSTSAHAKTMVKAIQPGIFKVELKVTDNQGLTTKDTLQLTVLAAPQYNVFFYFPDQTGSLGPSISTVPDNPTVNLVTVKITGQPNGILRGVWGKTYGPSCPVLQDPNSTPELFTAYNLGPGTYHWTAEIAGVDLSTYPALSNTAFAQLMAVPHTTGGTLIVPPSTVCMTVKVVF